MKKKHFFGQFVKNFLRNGVTKIKFLMKFDQKMVFSIFGVNLDFNDL